MATATETEQPRPTRAGVLRRIDEHLAAIPAGRELVTLDEHTDMLLDLRNLVAAMPTRNRKKKVSP